MHTHINCTLSSTKCSLHHTDTIETVFSSAMNESDPFRHATTAASSTYLIRVTFAPDVVGVQGVDNRTSDTPLGRSSIRDDVGAVLLPACWGMLLRKLYIQ